MRGRVCAPGSRSAGEGVRRRSGLLRHRRVVYKLVVSIRAVTTRFLLHAFAPRREGQTNQSAATLNLPVAFSCMTVFNVNALRKPQTTTLFICFGVGRLANAPEPSFSLFFDCVSDLHVFTRLHRPGHPPALPGTPGPVLAAAQRKAKAGFINPLLRTSDFISFFSPCMFSLFSQDLSNF